ncbi:Fungal protein of unknown function (DUF1748) [Nakaseomyces glabratus]
MTLIAKAVHLSVDLVLVSTCLAAVKRNTGLVPRTELIPNTTARDYFEKYLAFGESTYDYTVATCGTSSYFKR